MSRPVYFELAADNPERAAAFYSALFGWRIERIPGERPYWLIFTGDGSGIDGGLGPREPKFTAPALVIDVDDVDLAISRAIDSGGEEVYPKHLIPETGWAAYARDTEGNVFGLIQYTGPKR